MKSYRADLHIHTVLSPCGDLDMSPGTIVKKAKAAGLDIIGITDHNSTRHCNLVSELAAEENIYVLCGAEVNTSEEVHCLCFFPDFQKLNLFQEYLDQHLPDIKNDPDRFGYQVQVDEEEQIVYQEEKLLISAINQSIDQVEAKTHELEGLFIPAHIDRQRFSLISQLGFIPDDLDCDALEISRHADLDKLRISNTSIGNSTLIRSSDAHFIEDIGKCVSEFYIKEATFDDVRLALQGENGRYVTLMVPSSKNLI